MKNNIQLTLKSTQDRQGTRGYYNNCPESQYSTVVLTIVRIMIAIGNREIGVTVAP